MTLNTFIQYKFENTGQREKKKKNHNSTQTNPPLQSSRKHHMHSCKLQPPRKPAASLSREQMITTHQDKQELKGHLPSYDLLN